MTEAEFPHNNWYLKVDKENLDVINNWRINIIKCSRLPCPGNYINYLGAVGGGGPGRWVVVSLVENNFLGLQKIYIERTRRSCCSSKL